MVTEKEQMIVDTTVSADVLAPLGARTSAGTVMTQCVPFIYTELIF